MDSGSSRFPLDFLYVCRSPPPPPPLTPPICTPLHPPSQTPWSMATAASRRPPTRSSSSTAPTSPSTKPLKRSPNAPKPAAAACRQAASEQEPDCDLVALLIGVRTGAVCDEEAGTQSADESPFGNGRPFFFFTSRASFCVCVRHSCDGCTSSFCYMCQIRSGDGAPHQDVPALHGKWRAVSRMDGQERGIGNSIFDHFSPRSRGIGRIACLCGRRWFGGHKRRRVPPMVNPEPGFWGVSRRDTNDAHADSESKYMYMYGD